MTRRVRKNDDGVPVLETKRCILRGWRESDLDPYAAATADPEVTEFLGGPISRAQTWRSIAMFVGHWQLRGYGQWVLERREDGGFLGRVGLWYPEGWPAIEIGWTLARPAWGQGYASEGARAVVEWACSELDVDHLISVIAPANERSLRVARALGMAYERDYVLEDGTPTGIYGRELTPTR